MSFAATITEALDSGRLRVVGYLAATAIAVIRLVLERRVPRPRPAASWPTYWLLSALVLCFLGLSRATSLGGLIAEFGRDQARSEGWYESRRTIQAVVLAAVVLIWLLAVVIAVWRVPPRRRRYLPSIITISALVAFAAVRVVSLHLVDALLYRRGIGDVRFVAIVELGLLAATIATLVNVPRLVETVPADESEASAACGRD